MCWCVRAREKQNQGGDPSSAARVSELSDVKPAGAPEKAGSTGFKRGEGRGRLGHANKWKAPTYCCCSRLPCVSCCAMPVTIVDYLHTALSNTPPQWRQTPDMLRGDLLALTLAFVVLQGIGATVHLSRKPDTNIVSRTCSLHRRWQTFAAVRVASAVAVRSVNVAPPCVPLNSIY